MRLTSYTDYSLRVLIYLALNQEKRVTIADIVNDFDIPRNHLIKIVNQLAKEGFIETIRGKGGGMLLAVPLDDIRIGNVVNAMEPSMKIVDCEKPHCPLESNCQLHGILLEATAAFINSLNQYTLANLVTKPKQLVSLLSMSQ